MDILICTTDGHAGPWRLGGFKPCHGHECVRLYFFAAFCHAPGLRLVHHALRIFGRMRWQMAGFQTPIYSELLPAGHTLNECGKLLRNLNEFRD